MKRIFGIMSFFLALPAVAQEPCPSVRHTPNPDVVYKEGVDVKGWAVAPADLEPDPLAEKLKSPEVDLGMPVQPYANRAGVHADLTESRVPIGRLKVEEGRATLDGEPLSREEEGCEEQPAQEAPAQETP